MDILEDMLEEQKGKSGCIDLKTCVNRVIGTRFLFYYLYVRKQMFRTRKISYNNQK